MAQNQLLGAVAFTAQYSRETAEGGRETWDQAVDRVEAMHTRKFPYWQIRSKTPSDSCVGRRCSPLSVQCSSEELQSSATT
jgi:hypothetical protein